MLYIGPDQSISKTNQVTLLVVSSSIGDVDISCTPQAIIPTSITFQTPGKKIIQAEFPDIGVYTIRVTKDSETDLCTINANTDKCLIYGYITDIMGNPIKNEEVYIEPITKQGIATTALITYTDDAGYFAVPLLRGITVVIRVKNTGYRKVITVPNTNSKNIGEL